MSIRSERSQALVSLRRQATRELVGSAALLVGISALLAQVLGLSSWYVVKAPGLFVLAAWSFFPYLPEHLPHRRVGAANRVTLLRLALTALVAGGIGEAAGPIAWSAVVAASAALLLDGLDGWLARRTGGLSPFGARFDMETDALLVLTMAVLAWYLEKAGAWVFLSGLMRYLFVAAAVAFPWLSRPLPPSRRRKTVCVLQVLSLLLALAPVIAHPWSAAAAAAGLILLCYSFLVDIVWLRRRAARHEEAVHDGT